jgi:predicted N-acetyltransferase YhbS
MLFDRIGEAPGPMLGDYSVHIRNHTAWVIECDGTVAGLIVFLPEDADLLLDNIAVNPARHGRGIGRTLMRFAEKEASRRG